MNISERIKQLAVEQGISISQLETEASISNGSISKWSISMPKADSLYRVAKVLNKPIEYFLNESSELTFASSNSDEKELLNIYEKLDHRGKCKVNTVAYEELDRVRAILDPEQPNQVG